MRSSVATEAVKRGARARKEAGIGLGEPACPFEMSERLGIQVRLVAISTLEGLYQPDDPPLIIVGSQRPRGRRNYSCAHELGHHFYGHGQRIDELLKQSEDRVRDEAEQQADRFAAAVLMPKLVVVSAFRRRSWEIRALTPERVYRVSSLLGVGFSTLIDHMALSLNLLDPVDRSRLRRVRPKDIRREILGFDPENDLVVVDAEWERPTVDLDVGDVVLLPGGTVTGSTVLTPLADVEHGVAARAVAPGEAGFDIPGGRAGVRVRIAPRDFQGLAENRFLEDDDGDR